MKEIIDIVDDNDNVIGKANRQEIRKKALIHRVSRILVYDKNGHFLVHKRSATKDIYPGMWDIGVAETVQSAESYESAAIRGLAEEMGIKGTPKFFSSHKFRSKSHNTNYNLFEFQYDGKSKISMQQEEIAEFKFVPITDIQNMIGKNVLSPVAEKIAEKIL